MYEYEESKDFRFFSPALVHIGADAGDIVRIQRLGEPDAEFECALAVKGTPTHADWLTYCDTTVSNSPRHFGYT